MLTDEFRQKEIDGRIESTPLFERRLPFGDGQRAPRPVRAGSVASASRGAAAAWAALGLTAFFFRGIGVISFRKIRNFFHQLLDQ